MGNPEEGSNLPAVAKANNTPQTVPSESSATDLTKREKIFCRGYLVNYNPREAVRIARYKSKTKNALAIGQEMLRRADIHAYITELQDAVLESLKVDCGRIREEVAAIAFADPGDFLDFKLDAKGNPTGDISCIRFDKADTRVISGLQISETKDGDQRINIKLHNKLDALKMLGRDAGMFEEEQKAVPRINFHFHLGEAQ